MKAMSNRCLEYFGILLCLTGIAVAVGMNFSCRSLFCDEAMLVWNIETRSAGTLLSQPLELNQTAPLFYVCLLKWLQFVWGSSEWVYRLPSLLSYAFLPLAIWWVARKLFRVRHPWLCSGFCANLAVLLMYSNQVKPYMGEALWSLAALAVYGIFAEGKIPWWGVAAAWVLLGMCGNPVWFIVAGCLAHGMLCGLWGKNWRLAGRHLLAAGVFGVCMGVYFMVWLAPAAHAAEMQDFWKNDMLPWPVSFGAMCEFARILWKNFALAEFGKRAWFMVPMLGVSLGLVAQKKHPWGWVVWLGLGSALGASCLHLFPVSLRLWVFALPLCAILVFWTLEQLAGERWIGWAGLFLAVVSIANLGILRYWNPKNNYLEGEEVNDSVAFVREHLREGESVYVYCASIPGVQFKNGYGNSRMGSTSRDNMIWGGNIGKIPADLDRDVALVEESGMCWLIMTHAFTRLTKDFFERLASTGSLKIVHEFYGTPVYFYQRDDCGGKSENGLDHGNDKS